MEPWVVIEPTHPDYPAYLEGMWDLRQLNKTWAGRWMRRRTSSAIRRPSTMKKVVSFLVVVGIGFGIGAAGSYLFVHCHF